MPCSVSLGVCQSTYQIPVACKNKESVTHIQLVEFLQFNLSNVIVLFYFLFRYPELRMPFSEHVVVRRKTHQLLTRTTGNGVLVQISIKSITK